MRAERRGRFLWLLFHILLFNTLVSGEESDIQKAVIEQTEWRVGVAVLRTESNDPALLSAASLISRLVRDEISGIRYHKLRDAEVEQLIRTAVEQQKIESYTRVSTLYSSRDDNLFNLNADHSSLKQLEEQISEASTALSYWRYNPGTPSFVPERLPVIFSDPPDGGELWNVKGFSPEAFRKNAGLDVLIIGSIVRVGEYFGIRISALGSDGEDVLWEGAGGENDLEEISSEAGAAGRSLILGRAWSSITVQTDPPEAVITVNGESKGVGLWADSTLEPGPLVIRITAPGFAPKVLTEMLTPDAVRHLDISLTETAQPQVLIQSEPPGASIRLGSIWLGRAPLSLSQPDRVMSITVEKEGFTTRIVPLYPEAERLTIPLDYALVDPVEELAVSRKKLYNSIAWFSFSLAPTIILLGVSQNYANMNFASTSPEDLDSSYNAYQLTYGLMWGSVAVNIGFLTNVFFKLSRYLKAAEGLSD